MSSKFTKVMLNTLLILCTALFTVFPLMSQDMTTEEITEGREYWLGLPHCNREAGEAIRGDYPIAIWISSKVDTRATIEDAETGSIKNYVIRANQITQVPYGDAVMMTVPEEPKNFGIHVTADDPISVAVYMSYRWSGEAYRVTPVEWLGRKYVTLNLYQDRTDKYLPCQILIVATADNTVIKYRPTAATNKVNAGALANITLKKGQCFLIENKILANQEWDNVTDLTGTYIDANKPIAVISGHTKASFPRIQKTMLGRPTNFMKNMMVDMMWPIELLGKDYVTCPVKYTDRPRGVVQDDKGDMIRFVATEDSTIITQLRQNGSSFMNISRVLKRGQFHDIINQEVAAMYRANKKVLVGQYGKTWMDHLPSPITEKGEDQTLNPSRNGQGMLMTVAPIEQWTSYASWKSPANIDNFVALTFDSRQLSKLKFDGVSFTAKFGSSIRYIEGTDYGWLALECSAGDHYITGDTFRVNGKLEKARFAGYAYGNWDRSKDGFAYGYPIGINYNSPCPDSLYVIDQILCGDVEATAHVLPANEDCAGLLYITLVEATNYNFSTSDWNPGDKTASYYLKLIDPSKNAHAVVKATTRSGKTITKVFDFMPEQIAVDPTRIDFGLMKVGDKITKSIKLTNPGTVPVTVKNLRLRNNKAEFVIDTKDIPFTLQAMESKDVNITATALVNQTIAVVDSVIADLSCFSKGLTELKLSTGEPIVTIGDAMWSDIPVNTEESREVKIRNTGTIDVVLNTIDWPDKLHFLRVENLTFPLTLKPGGQHDFVVWYKPDKFGVVDQTRALFTGNTTKDKLYSDWVGNGIEPGPRIVGYDWKDRRVIDAWAGVTNYPYKVILSNTEGNVKVDIKSVTITDDTDGVFSLDQAKIPTQLQMGESFDLPAFFAPKEEKTYSAKVVLVCDFKGKEIIRTDNLDGIGKQPHVAVTGHDYGNPILVGNSIDDFGAVQHVTKVNPMPLTVFNLKIEGTDKDAFEIDPAFLANKANWQTIAVGQKLDVPIKFTALHPGEHLAQLVAECDAPENPVGELIGKGYTQGLATTDYDHGTLFVSQSNQGQVTFTNNGSDPITISQDLRLSTSGDVNLFYIKGWHTEKSGVADQSTFDVNPGDKLIVDVEFLPNIDKNDVDLLPNNIKDCKMTIEYVNSVGKAYSYVYGKAQILKTIARIPAGVYKVNPGTPVEVEYLIDKDSDEAKALSSGNITEFKAKVYFKSDGSSNVQDVYPANADPLDLTKFGSKDIITSGTMTEGWTIVETAIIGEQVLMVHFQNTKALDFTGNGGVLFKFKLKTFLSDLDLIPLKCELTLQGAPVLYTIVKEIPGDIQVNPVCVNTLRLIKLSSVEYNLAQSTPNPATTIANINYSVGLEAITNISLYNNSGEKVATLINQTLKPGDYTLSVDFGALNLSSGIYQYRMESGPFSQTRSIIITK